jgi:hypothetical protein
MVIAPIEFEQSTVNVSMPLDQNNQLLKEALDF